MRTYLLAVVVLVASTSCSDWIRAKGPVTRIGDGRVCVTTTAEIPGRGCATYDSPAQVEGFKVGDCVETEAYNESVRLHRITHATGCS